MREFFRGWRRKVGCATLVMACIALCVIALTLLPRRELVSQEMSPNRKWSVSEEFDWRSSCYCIILRDSAGKEIARDKARLVESYLIDSILDHRSELEITDESAGEKGRLIWRLDADANEWQVIPPTAANSGKKN